MWGRGADCQSAPRGAGSGPVSLADGASMRAPIVVLSLVLAAPAVAEPVEPPRGSALRAALLDAVRGPAEHDLGAPVEFVVEALRADGDVALARVTAQRPGGGAIDTDTAPLIAREGIPPSLVDGPHVVAFLRRGPDGAWSVETHSTGATDMWWVGWRCETYAALLPEGAC